ncbi:MAG: hypothetical protein LBS88_10660 [Tannerellaceae bacterium]|nr:hypothetical protein [Tannerellaceae bacterium]
MGAFQIVADSMDFHRHCEVRSNPGCPVWIASLSGSQGRPVMTILKYTRIHHGTQGVAAGYKQNNPVDALKGQPNDVRR